MTFSIGDQVLQRLEGIKETHLANIEELRKCVEWIEDEYFNPTKAPTSIAIWFSEKTNEMWDEYDALQKYTTMDPNFQQFIKFSSDEIEAIVDRFWKWSDRQMIDTKAAALLHNRSRSTIYRWIYKGKLKAKKNERGRWEIIA